MFIQHTQHACIMVPKTAFAKGMAAEYVVQSYWMEQGYTILEHRYKTRWGEIDLIVHRGYDLVFCEVKNRKTLAQGLHSLTGRHRQRLWQTAEHFVQNQDPVRVWETMQFDLVVVSKNNALPQTLPYTLTHIQNIFQDHGSF